MPLRNTCRWEKKLLVKFSFANGVLANPRFRNGGKIFNCDFGKGRKHTQKQIGLENV